MSDRTDYLEKRIELLQTLVINLMHIVNISASVEQSMALDENGRAFDIAADQLYEDRPK